MRAALLLLVVCLGCAPPALAQTPASEPVPAARDAAPAVEGRVPVPEPSDEALAYHRSGNVLWVAGNVWSLLVPVLILATGLSARIRTVATRVGRRWFFVVGAYFAIFAVLLFVADLPLAFYQGFVRQHAYGLSNQTLAKWASDQVIGLGVTLVVGALFLWIPYLLLARSPRRWWLYTGLLAVPFIVLMAFVAPLWIDPLFNRFGPMQDKALETRILDLAERSGIEGSRVFEVAKSEDTNAVNAYVTGFGDTKRIVLWDTLLAALDERQVLVVMGHEMGHYVLGHIWRQILIFSLLIMATLYLVHRAADGLLARYGRRFGFSELADVASLPLILVLFGAGSLAVTPVALAIQRHYEHEADRFALEITRDNHAAASAFVVLQQENLVVPRPGWLYKWWRASHPLLGERVDFSNDYRPWDAGEPLVYGSYFGDAPGE